jgi:bacteriocin biosynthesis cyclodehydratase domain-containing protein
MRPRHPGFPTQPALRPGVRVTRRADGELQVGLDASLAVVAPDTSDTRAVLGALRDGLPPPPPGQLPLPAARLCAQLLARGLVVDGAGLAVALAGADGEEQRRGAAAVFAAEGDRAADVLARRRAAAVEVVSPGLPGHARRLAGLLGAGGIGGLTVGTDGGARRRRSRSGTVPGAVVHLDSTEPDRSLVDGWVRADRPHLFVSATEGLVRVGPFVVPGSTACLRCVDAHLAERDPRRCLVVQQYADRADERSEVPVDAALLDLAVAYAARDLLSWVDGRRPRTWSTTVLLDAGLGLEEVRWLRHAGCGCSWGLAEAR